MQGDCLRGFTNPDHVTVKAISVDYHVKIGNSSFIVKQSQELNLVTVYHDGGLTVVTDHATIHKVLLKFYSALANQ